MDPQEKFEKGYFITTHRLGASDLYQVEFLPRGLQQWRGANNPSRQVPPGFKATVEVGGGEARFRSWDGVPRDPDVAVEHFEREAERLALEVHRRLQAA